MDSQREGKQLQSPSYRPERSFRRFFVYFCAFVGAGWFFDWGYQFASNRYTHWPSEFTWIIIAALVVALLFTRLDKAEMNDEDH